MAAIYSLFCSTAHPVLEFKTCAGVVPRTDTGCRYLVPPDFKTESGSS